MSSATSTTRESTNCLRCGRLIPPGSPQAMGPRPPVGVLLADDGSIWALRRGCLIGAEPSSAPEVQSGASEAITMKAGADHAMAPVQAEIQIRDWSTYLVDRGAEGGSWVQGPRLRLGRRWAVTSSGNSPTGPTFPAAEGY